GGEVGGRRRRTGAVAQPTTPWDPRRGDRTAAAKVRRLTVPGRHWLFGTNSTASNATDCEQHAVVALETLTESDEVPANVYVPSETQTFESLTSLPCLVAQPLVLQIV